MTRLWLDVVDRDYAMVDRLTRIYYKHRFFDYPLKPLNALRGLGPIESVCGDVAQFVPRTTATDGSTCPPSDVDDWSALIGRFQSGAVGVWEGTTLAKGYQRNGFGHEWAEINGGLVLTASAGPVAFLPFGHAFRGPGAEDPGDGRAGADCFQ